MTHLDRVAFAAALVRMVSLHDAETATHLFATAALARRLALHLQLSDEAADTVELGALLHDLGKVGVRRDLLRKRAELTAPEWHEMRLHAESGAQLLADTPPLAHLAPIVRAHHERIDGAGYPDRLRGDEIPLEARIVAVADAFHALTTDRPYRRAILPNAALGVLACAAGPQFDIDVVAAMLDLFALGRVRSRMSA